MRKIIDGQCYDTATATLVAQWDNGAFKIEAKRVDEWLYHSPEGNWFLHGRGGSATDYADSEDIRPLSPKEARAWLEEKGCDWALELWFNDNST